MSDRLRDQIAGFEGRCNFAYPDPLTGCEPWTIGVGHTGPDVHEHLFWSDEKIDATLDQDIGRATVNLLAYAPWASELAPARYAVLVNMTFQMGIHNVMNFTHTLHAVQTSDWQGAHDGMLDSQWARQTPTRAAILAKQMLTGEWQS